MPKKKLFARDPLSYLLPVKKQKKMPGSKPAPPFQPRDRKAKTKYVAKKRKTA